MHLASDATIASITTLLGTAVGATGAIAAAALTGRSHDRTQHSHWRRQLRRDTYARFLDAAVAWDDCLSDAHIVAYYRDHQVTREEHQERQDNLHRLRMAAESALSMLD